jgi:hypothetical protein
MQTSSKQLRSLLSFPHQQFVFVNPFLPLPSRLKFNTLVCRIAPASHCASYTTRFATVPSSSAELTGRPFLRHHLPGSTTGII